MAYRFTDTQKWQDQWFIELNPTEKFIFMYLCDNCDLAGFFELSIRRISFDTGLNATEIKGGLKGLSKGVFISKEEDCLLVKNFIRHQKNLPLNPVNNSHIGILKRIEIYLKKFENVDFSFEEGFICLGGSKGLKSPIGKGNGIGKGLSVVEIVSIREEKFKKNLAPYIKSDKNPDGIYSLEMVKAFFSYWSEINKSGTKMKFEMEKTWDLTKRLARWSDNNFGNKNNKNQEPSKLAAVISSADRLTQKMKDVL